MIKPHREYTVPEVMRITKKSYEKVSRDMEKGLIPVIRYRTLDDVLKAEKINGNRWVTSRPEIGVVYVKGEDLVAYMDGKTSIDPVYTEFRHLPKASLEFMEDYLKSVASIPLLTREQEKYLGRKIQEGSEAALHHLINSNLRLVVKIANRYRGYGLPLKDLVQAGNIGLESAAMRFDPERGFRFSTYSNWWIKQSIQRYIQDNGKTVRNPVNLQEKARKAKKLLKKHDEATVADMMGLKLPYLLQILEAYNSTDISTSAPIFMGSETSIEDTLSSPRDDPEKELGDDELNKHAVKILQVLTPKEQYVIERRCGFGDDGELTLEEIGEHFDISRERVRQIESTALEKMRRVYRRFFQRK